jgi:hypothetical protein
MIAFAGYQPSDAAEAVEILGGLKHKWMHRADRPEREMVEEPRPTLHDTLTNLIDRIGRWILEQQVAPGATPQPHYPTGILLSLHVPRAVDVMWVGRRDQYLPDDDYSSRGDVGRQTSIGRHMIHVAGQLWADTLARRAAPLLVSPPDTTPGPNTAGSENESAAPARAAPTLNNQPHEAFATGDHSNTSDNKRERGNFQPSKDSRGRLISPSTPSRRNCSNA